MESRKTFENFMRIVQTLCGMGQTKQVFIILPVTQKRQTGGKGEVCPVPSTQVLHAQASIRDKVTTENNNAMPKSQLRSPIAA